MNIYLYIPVDKIIYRKKVSCIIPIDTMVYLEEDEFQTLCSEKFLSVHKVMYSLESRSCISVAHPNCEWRINNKDLADLLIRCGFTL